MDVTVDEARELVADQALWPRVRDFLWDFAPQVHPSWVKDLFPRGGAEARSGGPALEGVCDAAALREAKSPRVRRFILDSLGVEPCFHAFPKDDGSRMLLLDGATLESAAKWLGALACVESLRRVTDGKSVRALKAGLPGIYPEVFGYAMYFKDLASRGDAESRSEDIVAEVVGSGYGLLLSVFSDLPASLVARLKFKLPKGLCNSESMRETGLSTIYKLFKLKFPEAYSLCC